MLMIENLEVKGISAQGLCLQAGDCVSLTAASGMGKSLFLKALADLLPNQGRLVLDGCERNDMAAPDWRRMVTFVGAKPAWWEDRVVDHFTDLDWLRDILPLFDLDEKLIDAPVARLSTGESQRLALIRALEDVTEGRVRYLLLDEPTAALDQARQIMVEEVLSSYLKAGLVAVLFVSHDERQVDRFAKRQWQIYNRRVSEVRS
ncbi:ABC transporter ATP-binding protein [Terasakiella pusilla]|uniref:ABC transporter ATP-binding protein n=1 Tax=Terasakiella pusilla TaxID=64973 RepID=UPI003AA82F2C